jgi:hypothetical protein
MLKDAAVFLVLIVGIALFVFGLLITYSDRFFRRWYGKFRGDVYEESVPLNMSRSYFIDRYWAGPHAALGGLGLIFVYILYNEKVTRYSQFSVKSAE